MRRPVLVVSADQYNASKLRTVTVVVLTGTTRLGRLPGNVIVPAELQLLPESSVVNVTQLVTLDRLTLEERIGELPDWIMAQIDAGLVRALGLPRT